MQINSRIGPYAVAMIGLLAITLGLFAIIWPYNGADFDDWSNIYVSREHMWNQASTDREFFFGSAALAQMFLPDRMGSLYAAFVFFTFANSVGIFYIIYRLSRERYAPVAFLTAAVYLGYIPYNLDQARILLVSPFPWVIWLGVMSAVILTEFYIQSGRLTVVFLIASAIFGYMAVRAYEALILPVGATPFLLMFSLRKMPSRRMMLGLGLWMLIVGVGVLQFAVPYVSGTGSSFYQANYQVEDVTPGYVIHNTIEFFDASFPLEGSILQTDFGFVAPGLFITLVFACGGLLLWRQSNQEMPSNTWLVLMLLTGIALTASGGGAAIYANIHLVPRSHYAASVGQSLVVTAILLGLAKFLGWQFRVRMPPVLLMLSIGFMFTASQWYLKAQIRAESSGLDLTINNDLWSDMFGLIPQTEPDTLIIYTCPQPTRPSQMIRGSSIAAPWLFYDRSRTEVAFAQYHVNTVDIEPPELLFFDDHISFEIYEYGSSDWDSVNYGYDQTIVVECTPDGLHILDTFPRSLAPPNARTDLYNPYARIINSYIEAPQAKLIAR